MISGTKPAYRIENGELIMYSNSSEYAKVKRFTNGQKVGEVIKQLQTYEKAREELEFQRRIYTSILPKEHEQTALKYLSEIETLKRCKEMYQGMVRKTPEGLDKPQLERIVISIGKELSEAEKKAEEHSKKPVEDPMTKRIVSTIEKKISAAESEKAGFLETLKPIG